jgi:hypothetical protein
MSTTTIHTTNLRCPVCNEVMDVITHNTEELSDMGAAMIGGDGRREHRRKSPQCADQLPWLDGWVEEKVS